MDENLVGYLLNSLDADSHQQVETYLRNHPEAQKKLDTLKLALVPLEADKEEIAPPPGLAYGAIAMAAEYRCRPHVEPPPAPELRGLGPERRWWRRSDLMVAASILILVGFLGTQGIMRLRENQSQLACQNNLRDFHFALSDYSRQNDGYYPMVPAEGPYNRPGVFLASLREQGSLGDKPQVSSRCPANGPQRLPDYTFDQLDAMTPEEREQALNSLSGCYAYSLGYRGPFGDLCGLRREVGDMALSAEAMPIMADCPEIRPDGGRGPSLNHRGGQNVLTVGGNVRFSPTQHNGIEGDDIYLNKAGKVAAGLHRWDSVLGTNSDQP
ncbi:MAG: hypothetical protein JNM56_05080 [Planctomycetia bacterium]|nr:hypothetical protein [Planctomycetia bacterium]